jgi:NAD(P)H-flavin reductase/hemoglobin-like flavoprotein
MAVGISESSGGHEPRRLPDYSAWRDRLSAAEPPDSRQPAESATDQPAPSLTEARLLKKSLTQLEPQREKAMAYFYAILFVRNPELRQMFPLALEANRQRTFDTLARYVWSCEQPGSITGWLSELARSSRKLGVTERHFRLFNEAMLATVRAFSGGSWSARTQAAWESALDHMALIMADAMQDCDDEPAWWLAEVTGHDQRGSGLAVLTLRPDQPLPYLPGQHVSVQVPQCPRVWREYSIANAPEPGGLLRLHVRAVPGGAVSGALVHQARPGTTLIVGPARGTMTAGAAAGGPVLCVAGGTGLAPVKAIVEALTSPRRIAPPPEVTLLFGARTEAGLYDLPDLRRLEAASRSLTVVPVVSAEDSYDGARGMLPDAVPYFLRPGTTDVFVSGPPALVTHPRLADEAAEHGARLHYDPP